MDTSQLNGANYEVDGESIDFFGAKGTKFEGDRWAINAFGGSLWVQVGHDSMLPVIREIIANDEAAGNSDKIAMLLLTPSSAVVFYLEGRLTRQHLTKATEGPDFVDIPDVEIDGRSLTVRVLGDPQFRVATADSEGTVI